MVPLCHFSRIPAKQLPTRFRAKLTSFFVCLSRAWIWGAVFLLGLLVMVAVMLLAVMAKGKVGSSPPVYPSRGLPALYQPLLHLRLGI